MALPSLEYRSVPLDQAEVWLAELESEGFTVVAAVAGDQVLLSHNTAQCQRKVTPVYAGGDRGPAAAVGVAGGAGHWTHGGGPRHLAR